MHFWQFDELVFWILLPTNKCSCILLYLRGAMKYIQHKVSLSPSGDSEFKYLMEPHSNLNISGFTTKWNQMDHW